MSDRPAKPVALLEQELALSAYLEALLGPAEAPAPPQIKAPAPPQTKTAVAPETQSPAPTRAKAPGDVVTPAALTAPGTASVPEWAASDFQALLFRVGGLQLAVPLVSLFSVEPRTTSPTALPGKPAWYLGLLSCRGRNAVIIDTALVVMPERLSGARADYSNVLLLDEGRVGLACDEVEQVVTLSAGAVTWRTARGRRPWLAGTVVEHMCALLDVSAFARMVSTPAARVEKFSNES